VINLGKCSNKAWGMQVIDYWKGEIQQNLAIQQKSLVNTVINYGERPNKLIGNTALYYGNSNKIMEKSEGSHDVQ